ncbi:GbsR/MarR family transcriptional regulator [Aquibacillus saliphilus]|uniref:GbsR/MarR family transcriptional regulator n=1 Tax=Aquibacillus saliphilus TaxID=1909422 RepID=UPI001CF04FC4|nr:helix-turn-helix domain-containing protein [Aquibacillus saliphilus]
MTENHLDEINNKVITEFSKTMEMFDLTSAEARLFSILYLKDSPMTLDQMSEELGKSKTSISTAVRNLLEMKLVDRVWKKGNRKDLYTADENLYKRFLKTFVQKRLETTIQQKQSLKEIESSLDKESIENSEVNHINNKLRDMIEFHLLIEQAFQNIYKTNP